MQDTIKSIDGFLTKITEYFVKVINFISDMLSKVSGGLDFIKLPQETEKEEAAEAED